MPEAVELLANSTKPLPRALFASPSAVAALCSRFGGGAKPSGGTRSLSAPAGGAALSTSGSRRGSSIVTESVGSQFRGQLAKLISDIGRTAPHYVRCLKPNDTNAPGVLDRRASPTTISFSTRLWCRSYALSKWGVALRLRADRRCDHLLVCGVCCVAAARRAAPLRRCARGRARRARRLPGAFRFASPLPPRAGFPQDRDFAVVVATTKTTSHPY